MFYMPSNMTMETSYFTPYRLEYGHNFLRSPSIAFQSNMDTCIHFKYVAVYHPLVVRLITYNGKAESSSKYSVTYPLSDREGHDHSIPNQGKICLSWLLPRNCSLPPTSTDLDFSIQFEFGKSTNFSFTVVTIDQHVLGEIIWEQVSLKESDNFGLVRGLYREKINLNSDMLLVPSQWSIRNGKGKDPTSEELVFDLGINNAFYSNWMNRNYRNQLISKWMVLKKGTKELRLGMNYTGMKAKSKVMDEHDLYRVTLIVMDYSKGPILEKRFRVSHIKACEISKNVFNSRLFKME